MEQRSEEWFAARAGKFTGSRFNMLMAKLASGKPAASYFNLITELAVERITGQCMETYQNAAMLRGIEMEPEARAAYEDENLVAVDEVAFIQHPKYPFVGCSPDGLVGDEGMWEGKCPYAAAKHLDALLRGAHTVEYKWQLQGQLWVAVRDWVDASSYDPRFPEGTRLATVRVERDEDAIKELEQTCIKANDEVEKIVGELENRMRKAA
jgi:putative phage-type endonuclease